MTTRITTEPYTPSQSDAKSAFLACFPYVCLSDYPLKVLKVLYNRYTYI